MAIIGYVYSNETQGNLVITYDNLYAIHEYGSACSIDDYNCVEFNK
ncbi:hypothetical protein JCM31447_17990 [Fluviispira sanaruensis]|uniref:Uncharacterized protein n=1 Tax=Fluviispira sanaruensis TaxID=2493639 RepID=A0A4P2VJK8_FLUSA|nr:hypothetical protein JCM31447_17990 [Fluviispira sanaruensis]